MREVVITQAFSGGLLVSSVHIMRPAPALVSVCQMILGPYAKVSEVSQCHFYVKGGFASANCS